MKQQLFSALCLLALAILGVIAVKAQLVSNIVSKDAPATHFSAERAMEHLKIIAKAPHSGGTTEHQKVLEYLANYCRSQNLEVSIQDTTAAVVYGSTKVNASRVQNLLARLKGKDSSKKNILVLSHYDSQPNTLGAADDGAGIVGMLETIRALNAGPRLEHDVLFLFSDQEEVGLLGAEAFVNCHPAVGNTGAMLNYESRGNSGVAYVFEVNSENGWVIPQFKAGAPYPVANSMAYEIYNLLPNSTDFTRFKRGNYTGINQANVDGYAHYHNMTDTPENIDIRLVQHHGSNMLGMIRQFDQQDLNNTKAPDVNYFNPFGHWLWIFPVSWNLPLIILCILLYFALVFQSNQKNDRSPFLIFLNALQFLIAIVLTLALTWILLKIILGSYPHYANHYGNNFYNSPYYLYAFLGITWIVFSTVYSFLFKKMDGIQCLQGALLINLILMLVMHFMLPTASFLMYYPLIILIIFNLIAHFFPNNQVLKTGLHAVGLIPTIALYVPIVYTLYVVFSLILPYAATLLFALLLGLFTPFFVQFREKKWALLSPGILMLCYGVIAGHLNAPPTPTQPLQTSLNYFLDHDNKQATWFSPDVHHVDWVNKYASKPSTYKELNLIPIRRRIDMPKPIVWSGEAPLKPIPPARINHQMDTLANQKIKHTITITPQHSIIGCEMLIDGISGTEVELNGRPINWTINDQQSINHIILHYINPSGFTFSFTSNTAEPFKMTLVERALRIPKDWLNIPRPDNLVSGPGYYSDVIITQKTYEL